MFFFTKVRNERKKRSRKAKNTLKTIRREKTIAQVRFYKKKTFFKTNFQFIMKLFFASGDVEESQKSNKAKKTVNHSQKKGSQHDPGKVFTANKTPYL